MSDSLPTYLLLCLSACVAGVMNSVAGGGTLFTFSALLLVVDPIVANATSANAMSASSDPDSAGEPPADTLELFSRAR